MVKCGYCGEPWQEKNGRCIHCTALNTSRIDYMVPFFEEGFIIYPIREYMWDDCIDFHFYRGVTYHGRVRIYRREMEELGPAASMTPLCIEKFYEKYPQWREYENEILPE